MEMYELLSKNTNNIQIIKTHIVLIGSDDTINFMRIGKTNIDSSTQLNTEGSIKSVCISPMYTQLVIGTSCGIIYHSTILLKDDGSGNYCVLYKKIFWI